VNDEVQKFVESDTFEDVWVAVNRRAHAQIVVALTERRAGSMPLRELLATKLTRGKVECRLAFTAATARSEQLQLNADLLASLKSLVHHPLLHGRVGHIAFSYLCTKIAHFILYVRESVVFPVKSLLYLQAGLDVQFKVLADGFCPFAGRGSIVFIESPQKIFCIHGVFAVGKKGL